MKKNCFSLVVFSQTLLCVLGINSEDFIVSNACLDLSPNTSHRADWIIKGDDGNRWYINEIQVRLGKEENELLLKKSKDLISGTTPHFTVLTTGKLIQHAYLDQIAHSHHKSNLRQILQDQYLIYVDVAGREPNINQIQVLHQLINDIRKRIPSITVRWSVLEPYLLAIPWIKEPNVFQYSDNLYLYKLFNLTQHSSDISTIAEKPVYWVPSMNFHLREDNMPQILNVFRTGKALEETCVDYLNKNKKTSAHFTIDENGRIVQHLSLDKASFFVTPSYGLAEVGRGLSSQQITIGLSGSLEYPITLPQKESLREVAKFLLEKYKINNWTTPAPPVKDAFILGKELLPDLKKLKGVHLTQDPKLVKAQSLIYSYPSPNQSKRPENKIIDTIVLHHTHSSWHGANISFSSKDSISAHFTINQDGMIVQHVPLEMKAWHAGVSKDKRGFENVNEFSIGIELVNTGDCKDPYTDEQVTALKGLLYDLKNILGKDLYQITTHEYVALPKGRKNDPLGFPWKKLAEFNEYIVRNTDETIMGN